MEGAGVTGGAGEDLKGPKDARRAPCPTDSLALLPSAFSPSSSLWSSEVSVEERKRRCWSAFA